MPSVLYLIMDVSQTGQTLQILLSLINHPFKGFRQFPATSEDTAQSRILRSIQNYIVEGYLLTTRKLQVVKGLGTKGQNKNIQYSKNLGFFIGVWHLLMPSYTLIQLRYSEKSNGLSRSWFDFVYLL